MVEAPLGFLAVEMECVFGHVVELCEPHLGQAPEALDAIDVNRAASELIAGMVDPEVTIAKIDEAVVAAPKQRNSREENARIKAGETPEGWADKPAKRSQKDTDARWTKKRGQSHYGYKNHINVDRRHKLVRHYEVTDASVHDSQVLDDILDGDNTALGVWADSAYRSAEIEAALKAKGLRSRIHRKGRRNKPLSDREKQGNKTRSSVRVRVEHVFGAQSNDMGGTLVRSIGKVRATARIGLKNLAYNMRRLVQLERLGAATA